MRLGHVLVPFSDARWPQSRIGPRCCWAVVVAMASQAGRSLVRPVLDEVAEVALHPRAVGHRRAARGAHEPVGRVVGQEPRLDRHLVQAVVHLDRERPLARGGVGAVLHVQLPDPHDRRLGGVDHAHRLPERALVVVVAGAEDVRRERRLLGRDEPLVLVQRRLGCADGDRCELRAEEPDLPPGVHRVAVEAASRRPVADVDVEQVERVHHVLRHERAIDLHAVRSAAPQADHVAPVVDDLPALTGTVTSSCRPENWSYSIVPDPSSSIAPAMRVRRPWAARAVVPRAVDDVAAVDRSGGAARRVTRGAAEVPGGAEHLTLGALGVEGTCLQRVRGIERQAPARGRTSARRPR